MVKILPQPRRRGFSLIEAVTALGVLSFVGFAVSRLISQQHKAQATFETKSELVELMQLTLTEINEKKAKNLPAVQTCIVRTYGPTALFQNEASYPITSTNCLDAIPIVPGFKITLRILPASNIEVNFDPASFLKLPQYLASVKMIQIWGGFRDGNQGKDIGQLAATIFRKDA